MPRLVHMVFSASGVTMMRQQPVLGPSGAGRPIAVLDAGGPDVMGKELAEGVVPHLSDEAGPSAPRDARQAAVLAAEPPDTSVAGPREA